MKIYSIRNVDEVQDEEDGMSIHNKLLTRITWGRKSIIKRTGAIR